ncbi:17138_t:CDS:1, partial [Racocetra persica]
YNGSNSSQDNFSNVHRPALPPPQTSIFINAYQQDGVQNHDAGNTLANKLPPILPPISDPPSVPQTGQANRPSRPRYKVKTDKTAWTVEEDNLLRLAVQLYGDRSEKWTKIAACVPNRTNKMCRKRWFHSLDPNLRKGPWTKEEDELLMKAVEKHKKVWCKVAESIPGRTDDQCAKRWKECLDPEIDHTEWTDQEDLLLMQKYAELGTQWQKISKFFPGRPGLHCRNRWRKIERTKKSAKEPSLDMIIITPDDISPTTSPILSPDLSLQSNLQSNLQPHIAPTIYNPSQSMKPSSQAHLQQLNVQPTHLSAQDILSQNSTSVLESNLSSEPTANLVTSTTSCGPSIASLLSSPSVNGPMNQPTINMQNIVQNVNVQNTQMNMDHVPLPPPTTMEVENDTSTRAYGCGVLGCELNFANSNGLYYHMKAAHPSVNNSAKPYRCALPGCCKSYKNINGLQYHIANAKGSSGHQCDNNEEGSSETVVKPHKCQVAGCKNSYRTPNGLQYHQKHIHGKESDKYRGTQVTAPSSTQRFDSEPSTMDITGPMDDTTSNNNDMQHWTSSDGFIPSESHESNPPSFTVPDAISVGNLLDLNTPHFDEHHIMGNDSSDPSANGMDTLLSLSTSGAHFRDQTFGNHFPRYKCNVKGCEQIFSKPMLLSDHTRIEHPNTQMESIPAGRRKGSKRSALSRQ